MGADGGFRIAKIQDIREKWENLRETLIECTLQDFNNSQDWNIETRLELHEATKKLPKSIVNRSNNEIVAFLQIYRSCDCPVLIDDSVYFGEGDYVENQMHLLSFCIRTSCENSIYIETWT